MNKVLVVDDELFVRKGIVSETDWVSLGFETVLEAANGQEALEVIHREAPDLLVCDIRMPKMNGLELLKKLREEENRLPVIFLTAYSEFEYAKEALKLYAFDYILKPFEDGELEKAVLRARKQLLEVRGSSEGREDKTVDPAGKLLPFDENTPGLSGYVRAAAAYIAAHYGENDMSVSQVAEAVGISEGHLSHHFKKETGCTVTAYLTRYRMAAAMRLLSDCRNKVYEVAAGVGYKDIAYFSSSFKKMVGMTPSEFQDKR
ncbi:MAG: response regulator [Lachnospiraceae bacterium]|nr:response regulator [Lachnospiraceae bacterium]